MHKNTNMKTYFADELTPEQRAKLLACLIIKYDRYLRSRAAHHERCSHMATLPCSKIR